MHAALEECSITLLKEEDAAELAALEAEFFSTFCGAEQYREVLRDVWAAVRRAPELQKHAAEKRQVEAHALSTEAKALLMAARPVFGIRDEQGRFAAYIGLGAYHDAGELEIFNIAVRRDCRCQGLGRRLLGYVLDAARQHGFHKALLEVSTGNQAALKLYASAGFAVCGRRRAYYADTGEDALIMQCELGAVSQ